MKEIKPKDRDRREGIEKELEMNGREKLECLALLPSTPTKRHFTNTLGLSFSKVSRLRTTEKSTVPFQMKIH